ncbi:MULTISPECIES: hypothetical protein [unclassified Chelatococcus]|uniref:hypothetical protein n=1 Tax=unclassified Chelatococcus TaxID=2638111 RepID=UPI001BCC1BD3|nr:MULTISPECIES: hypothetical protein [unclassified Chelatococcus]MBS7697834.1 hypothetical protein [Chelatococcus sp. YT9]MBS7698566.1 hypothetical protein [Chelatococcus sp. YT9]MBX3559811.1 hypothetical protein [Chelatococcus sp.]
MEARERLARLIDPHSFIPYVGDGSSDDVWASDIVAQSKADALRKADAILKALHLTDAAALALMDGEGVVVPKDLTDDVRYVSWFVQYKSRGGSDGDADLLSRQRVADPYQVAIDHASYDAVLAASPYKENPDDPR